MHAAKKLLAVAVVAMLAGGCERDEGSTAIGEGTSQSQEQGQGQTQAQAGYVSGRVTMPDGKTPLTGDIKDIQVVIHGVSEAAEKVSYTPVVKPDGTYRQKVSGGQYSFSTSRVVVLWNGQEFTLPLEPVGNLWNKNRDAADGIVQDFVWKPTGVTPYGQSNGADVNNHTHWYGMSVGMRFQTYRSDLGKGSTLPPDGTKLVFTLTPKSKSIDGSELQPIVRELTFNAKEITPNDDIADLPPADYEVTGVAQLPDGSTKPIMLQGAGDYPNYVTTMKAKLERDNLIGGYFKLGAGYGID